MWCNYKIDEKQLTEIMKNVKTIDCDHSIELNIFLQNQKIEEYLNRNNPHKSACKYKVVYQYNCNEGECNSQIYIGYTEQTLEERFQQHQSIIKHLNEVHRVTRRKPSELQSIEVLHNGTNKQELLIMEALFIAAKKPTLGSQKEGRDRVLRIF